MVLELFYHVNLVRKQLSNAKSISLRRGLNTRPKDLQSFALPLSYVDFPSMIRLFHKNVTNRPVTRIEKISDSRPSYTIIPTMTVNALSHICLTINEVFQPRRFNNNLQDRTLLFIFERIITNNFHSIID